MSGSNAVDDFLALVDSRLQAGEREYGDQSFVKPIAQTCVELDQELADLVGWLYVLHCQAARKGNFTKDQKALRPNFIEELRRRLHRNDRGKRGDYALAGIPALMDDIEIIAMDAFEFAEQFRRRLKPIARAIEVAQVMRRDSYDYRGRRGSVRNPRSDD
jgi:hypothetical protein